LEHCVADAYRCKRDELLSIVRDAFENRVRAREKLREVIPGVKADILSALYA